ncbi:hypothetical protein K525DRAFT_185322 [Schizophyllum commune Loenen D]|nr:hypothetical protein K525DRAFT_185322 [Schizophyllum commune Loenen D]
METRSLFVVWWRVWTATSDFKKDLDAHPRSGHGRTLRPLDVPCYTPLHPSVLIFTYLFSSPMIELSLTFLCISIYHLLTVSYSLSAP